MNRRFAHLLTHLYPRSWRERYGEEFEEFLLTGRGGLRAWFDVVRAALVEHFCPTKGGMMIERQTTFGTVLRQPSALVPMALSLTALAVLLVHIGLFGVAREADEGTAAHIWQLLMAAQLPALVIFGVRWLPKAPKQAMLVFALLVASIVGAMAPVFIFNL